MLIASLNPLRNTPPSAASRTRVTVRCCPPSALLTSGFSTRCAEASAADRVIVMTKPVATKPRRRRTSSLPGQYDSSRSSIDIEPSPCGLSPATRRYIGRAAEQRDEDQDEGRDGGECTRGEGRDARLVAEGGEVVDAGQAHDPPPRLDVLLAGRLPLVLVVAAGVALLGVEEPFAQLGAVGRIHKR